MKSQRPGLLLLLVLPVVAGLGCSEERRQPKRVRGERLPRVEVVKPKRTGVLRRVKLAATVVPLQSSDLSARVPGTVDYMPRNIDIGRSVKKGDKLVHLAVPDLEADRKSKEALLEQMRKQVVQAQKALAVVQEEVKEATEQEKKYVADADYQRLRHKRISDLVRAEAQNRELQDEAFKQLRSAEAARDAATAGIRTREARVFAAEADLEVARRKVEVAEADLARSKAQLSFATVIAPFDGVITHRWVDEGAVIKDAGARLLRVMQLRRVRVLIDIPQREVQHVNAAEDSFPWWWLPGSWSAADKVVVRISDLAEVVTGGEFQGTVTRRSRALDPVTRTMRAEVELDNKAGHLKPGMYGEAELFLDERQRVMTIPTTALVPRGGNKVGVFIVADAQGVPARGQLKFVELARGLDDGERVEVRGIQQGNSIIPLKDDVLIVAKGNGVLRVGEQVQALFSQDEEK